jgi:hypothetical protein
MFITTCMQEFEDAWIKEMSERIEGEQVVEYGWHMRCM